MEKQGKKQSLKPIAEAKKLFEAMTELEQKVARRLAGAEKITGGDFAVMPQKYLDVMSYCLKYAFDKMP